MINRIRLISGLVLFAYVLSHFANHGLGLISLESMEAGRRIFLILWRSLPGTILLYGALAVHFALGLYALYRRREFRMPAMEAGQLLLGLAAVPLLAEHVLGTRLLHEVANVNDSYTYVVLVLWKLAPAKGVLQAMALLVVWSHAVIGLGYWLRLKPAFLRLLPWLTGLVVLVPVLALLGFVSAGREIAVRAREAGWLVDAKARINWPQEGAVELVHDLQQAVWLGVAAALAAVLAARAAKALWERRRGTVVITYPGPREVRVRKGTSVLETSRLKGIPHASVCGGRGRCSTCRVRVGQGRDDVTPPREEERRVLKRVGAAPDMRLACQLRPEKAISVTPVLAPTAGIADAHAGVAAAHGHEQEIAILFADVRGFTELSDGRLPYDVVFILNRYFTAMGKAVEGAGGRIDKFMGDGVMALFGVGEGGDAGARNAIKATRAMARELIALNRSLEGEISSPIRIGIGIHMGPVILGEMGYGRARQFTAIGDSVNTASRLESLTKEYGCQLVLSEDVARASRLEFSPWPRQEVEVRGLKRPLTVIAIEDATTLPGEA